MAAYISGEREVERIYKKITSNFPHQETEDEQPVPLPQQQLVPAYVKAKL